MIELEDSAKERIADLYIDEKDPEIKGLRIFVQGGGCSGFQYGFVWDNSLNEDDFQIEVNDKVKVLVDAMSAQYLQGAKVKYKTTLFESSFVIENPNVSTTCGCGSSFSV